MLLDEKAYNFSQKVLSLEHLLNHHINDNNTNLDKKYSKDIDINEIKIDKKREEKRIIGSTDYKKFEDLSKELQKKEDELEKEKNKKYDEAHNHIMGCNNDLRKERQLMEKPNKEKIEAAKRFKDEGDDLLKSKKYDEAINIYEKGLLQLFYAFSDDKNEDELIDKIKEGMDLNCSFCKIKQEKYEEATHYLNEAMRVNKENLKTLYRMAFCHYKLEKFDEAKNEIGKAMQVIERKGGDKEIFQALIKDINNTIKDLENKQNNLLKKMVKNK